MTATAAPDLTNATIQQLIDAAAARSSGGATVTIPTGIYLMHDALHLRSGVRVVGATGSSPGTPGVVLKKAPSVESPIADFLGYGHFEFTVREPEKFRVGMGVHLLDDKAGGFYTTVATITGRRGDLFFIDRPFAHDYMPGDHGKVISLHPLVEATGVHDASIENIALDGNSAQEKHHINGCRAGGVFLITSRNITVKGVEVRDFRGEGVSFQQCTDIRVEGCRLHHNTGNGLHPGSGSVRYVLRGNDAHDNGACGVFYCLRTTHSLCEGNRLEHNRWNGISVGERDTDHLIRNNVIADNGCPGVEFRVPVARSGDRVIVEGNTFRANCRTQEPAELMIRAGLRDIHVLGNTFEPLPGKAALRVEAGCERITFAGNTVSGRPQAAGDVTGEVASVAASAPAELPAGGPAALPPDGARHLGIPELTAWR